MERFDVVVIGAGPAGSSAARAAARGGARTLLLDRRREIGHPVQCGEFLPTAEELADLFDDRELIGRAYAIPTNSILRATQRMVVYSPFGRRYSLPLRGYTVSRRAYDKALALLAEGEGAELRHPAAATRVRDDLVELADGSTISGRVVIGADGPISTVGRSVGFAPEREMYRMITATVPGASGEEIDLFFGQGAPGGYAWAFPRADDTNVGLGVRSVPRGASLDSLLDRFVQRFGLGAAVERTRWWVPLGPPPASLVVGRALFCGDAANLVMATNGGGIPTAVLSGWLAGEAAAAHVREGEPLSAYDERWKRALELPLARAYAVKRRGDRWAARDPLLALAMRYIGSEGLDRMMRLRWPTRHWGSAP